MYYSPARRCFLGKHLPLERYTGPGALRALCRLLGPAGARGFESVLLARIADDAARVRGAGMEAKRAEIAARISDDHTGDGRTSYAGSLTPPPEHPPSP